MHRRHKPRRRGTLAASPLSLRTIDGRLLFGELRAEALERAGVRLTWPRAPAWERELLGGAPDAEIVSLYELAREGLFPRPTGKPGKYHRDAVELVRFLVARLGLWYPQDDPRRIARGRPERDQLRQELVDRWTRAHRLSGCAECEATIDRLVGLAAREDPQTSATLLKLAGEAGKELRQLETEAERLFYSLLGTDAKEAKYRTDARLRDLAEVIDEQIVFAARNALTLRRREALLDQIDLEKREVRVTYVLRPGPDGRPTSRSEPPTVVVARRRPLEGPM